MLQDQELSRIIKNKYIAPLHRTRSDLVGVEFELPVVHFGGQPVSRDLMQALVEAFIQRFHFDRYARDDAGRIYTAQNIESADDLSFDCSFNTLELSLGCLSDLNVIDRRFQAYYRFIQDFLLPYDHTLTGCGINPNYRVNENVPVEKGRYRMLYHHLSSYPDHPEKKCHNYPNFGMFSCASQVQLDVDEDNVLLALNTLAKLEPLNSLLFANSYFEDDNVSLLCSRDYFWRESMQGYNPHNLDMYETELGSLNEIISYIATESMYCLERDGKYINFSPMTLHDYFSSEAVEGEYWDGSGYRTIQFRPEPEDIKYHRSYKFEDLTFRGTLEHRSVCEQPVADIMSVSAYFAGLMECLPELKGLLDADTTLYGNGYNATELRRIVNVEGVPEFADPAGVQRLLLSVLDLAESGLHRRGYHEEHFLKPLYSRAEALKNPAQVMREKLSRGESADDIARDFAKME